MSQTTPTKAQLKQLSKEELATRLLKAENENSVLKKKLSTFEASVLKITEENSSLKSQTLDLKNEFNEFKSSTSPTTAGTISTNSDDFHSRLVEVEKRLYLQEQYSRRECLEIHGFGNVEYEKIEETAIELLNRMGNNVSKSMFHAIHRLKNKNAIILKAVNRRTAKAIILNTAKLCEIDGEERKNLNLSERIYINESLCPYFRKLFGKCNALYKKELVLYIYIILEMVSFISLPKATNNSTLIMYKTW